MGEIRPGSRFRRWALLACAAVVLVPPLAFAAWAWMTLHFAYSTGERAGYIQKISKKGWLCKSWEGELAMSTLPGTAPQIFNFSVRDEQVARQIERESGKPVSLSYEQHRGVPTSCFGETEYYITNVRAVGR